MAKTSKPSAAVAAVAPSIGPEKALSRLQKLFDEIPQLRTEGSETHILTTWRQNVEGVLSQYYGRPSLQLGQFNGIYFKPRMVYPGMPSSEFIRARIQGVATAEGFLQSRITEINEDFQEAKIPPVLPGVNNQMSTHKVFVVHGHDYGSKETVARYLEKLGLEPVILHEKPNQGRTLIEKFEHHADVPCAGVILSPDDIGYAKSAPTVQEERARQNVIFEMGFFVGRLGWKHTFALVQKGVTRPSDIDGVLYIPMDDDTWKMKLVGELKAAGMDVDANKAFG